MRKKFFSAMISAVLLATASIGITASAEETASENQETTTVTGIVESAEKSTETNSVEKTASDYFADDYYDTGGNATLIKEENIIYNSEKMQFIAVTTKDGHVFYVLINYSAESGEDAVYFLNKVDDYDLYALLYAGDEEKKITPEQAFQAAENANGRVQNNSENTTENSSEITENDEVSVPVQVQKNPANMNMIYLVIVAVVLAVVGIAAMKFMKKPKKNITSEDENYDFYDDSDDEE